ncbi:MAG: hypothetical protein AB1641_08765 [Thermodesulfobacteriota bacterium]
MFWLPCNIFGFGISNSIISSADLPIGPKFDAVGRVNVNHLDLAFEAFLFGQGSHHVQRIAENHTVGPVGLVPVELDLLLEIQAVEVGEEVGLRLGLFLMLPANVLDYGLGVYLLLDVDGHGGHGQVFPVLLVLAFPDQLRVQGGVAGIEDDLGLVFLFPDKVPQFLGGYILSFVFVLDALNFL